MSKLLYLDNAATTKTAPEVVEAMLPYFTEKFGNPSSVYSFAAANKEVINQQRDAIAEMIGAKSLCRIRRLPSVWAKCPLFRRN